jgi:hypothetical protein
MLGSIHNNPWHQSGSIREIVDHRRAWVWESCTKIPFKSITTLSELQVLPNFPSFAPPRSQFQPLYSGSLSTHYALTICVQIFGILKKVVSPSNYFQCRYDDFIDSYLTANRSLTFSFCFTLDLPLTYFTLRRISFWCTSV